MDRDIEQLEQFDSYFRDELSPAAKEQFEKKLSGDEGFRKNYESYLIALSAVQHNSRKNLINEFVDPSEGQANFKRLLRIAAVVTVLAVAFIFAYQAFKAPSSEEIFLSHYEKDDGLILQKPRGASEDFENLTQAFTYYKEGHYQESLGALEKISNLYENPTALYLQGLTYMEQSKFEQAISSFRGALEYDSPLEEDISWYLALALLSEERNDEALETLRSLQSDKYRTRVEDIIKQL